MNKVLLVGVLGIALVLTSAGQARAQVVEKDKKVTLEYTLTVDGKVFDTSVGKKPIEFIAGTQQVIPGLEKALMGLKIGDEKTVEVPSAEAYGPPNPNAIQSLPRSIFPKELELKVGMVVPLQNKEGQTFPATVKEVSADKVLLDFNNPLAGKDLTFKVKIIDIK